MKLVGAEHNELLNWLSNDWFSGDSPVCFLEGFPGTGKTSIARELLTQVTARNITAVMITVPETERDATDDILLDLATEFNSAGRHELAQAIENNQPLLDVLDKLVKDQVLIIIDEFQRTMVGRRAITRGGFAKVLSRLADRRFLKGRILLVTNRLVERARWSEAYAIKTIKGMSAEDGVQLLEHYATDEQYLEDISHNRRRDVVTWLGGNPRAIRLLVHNLRYETFDELVGEQPELWEIKDREVSPDLVQQLERELLKKSLIKLSEEFLITLFRLCVHRKPFRRQAIEHLVNNDKNLYASFRQEMIDRFLIERNRNWYTIHPIVREIGLQKLTQSPDSLQQAHRLIIPYYTRHFTAKAVKGWGKLGGYFVEARYHILRTGNYELLDEISASFQKHIFFELSQRSEIPQSPEELDERIAVLSALLDTPGPKNLEHLLAKLFFARNQRNDLRRALNHSQRAIKRSKVVAYWLLCGDILVELQRPRDAVATLKRGIERVHEASGQSDLYIRCARILAANNSNDEAISLLKEAVLQVPVNKGLAGIYDALSQLLIQSGKWREAVEVLQRGIEIIPSDKSRVDLYNRCSDLLIKLGKFGEATSVLERGIKNIPPENGLMTLYIRYSELEIDQGNVDSAISILERGIKQAIPSKSGTDIYYRLGDLLNRYGQKEKAIAVLRQGIRQIPSDKGAIGLYQLCSQIFIDLDQSHLAIELLNVGIDKIPPNKGGTLLIAQLAKALVIRKQTRKAIEILRRNIVLFVENGLTMPLDLLTNLNFGLNDESQLTELIESDLLPREYASYIQVLLLQIRNQWQQAAEYAHQHRNRGEAKSELAILESFAWLCAGKPRKALESVGLPTNQHSQWLVSYINLHLGDEKSVAKALTDEEHTQDESLDQMQLLNAWNTTSNSLQDLDLAFYFPVLPTSLTGFDEPISRTIYHPTILPQNVGAKEQRADSSSLESEPPHPPLSVPLESPPVRHIPEVKTENSTLREKEEAIEELAKSSPVDGSINRPEVQSGQSNTVNIILPSSGQVATISTEIENDVIRLNETDLNVTQLIAELQSKRLHELTNQKMFLDDIIRKVVRRFFIVNFLVFVTLYAGLIWFIFSFGWDRIEPWTFIVIGGGWPLLQYLYIGITAKELNVRAFYESYHNRQRQKIYSRSGFDINEYRSLSDQLSDDTGSTPNMAST